MHAIFADLPGAFHHRLPWRMRAILLFFDNTGKEGRQRERTDAKDRTWGSLVSIQTGGVDGICSCSFLRQFLLFSFVGRWVSRCPFRAGNEFLETKGHL